MADTTQQPGTAPPAGDDGAGPPFGWVDAAGIAAAVVLVFIVADIMTDGRVISRRLLKWRGKEAPDAAPDGP